MKKRRKKQKREKMIMLWSSVFVLTALTMTGVYVKERNQVEDDGYVVDLSQLENKEELEEHTVVESEQPKTTVVSSSRVEKEETETQIWEEEVAETTFPWEWELVQEESAEETPEETPAPQEEELAFSEDEVLLWPVVGNVLINYSMDKPVYFSSLQQYKYNPAIIIQAQEGQNITASADGKVTKIVKEEQTGNTIYMDLGSGYEITYGQLTNMQVKEGDRVKKGDYIADVAAPTRYFSEEGSNVYFALKKDGTPVDPMTKLD